MEREPVQDADLERRIWKFWQWNGDGKPPQFTHWTPQGTVIIKAHTPGISSIVLWRPSGSKKAVQIGDPDDNFPEYPAKNLYHGKFDADAGFAISKLVPDHISKWNNLGG